MIINVSKDYKINSQRNNSVLPYDTCNTTSMVNALTYLGYKLPDISTSVNGYMQPEDRLTEFIINSKDVIHRYKKHYPEYYKEYINKVDGYYNPFEIHEILSYGTNLWMRQVVNHDVTKFTEKLKLNDIIKELSLGKPIVLSGRILNNRVDGSISYYNHIITLVGIEFNDELSFNDIINDPSKVNKFIIDDSYGKTSYYQQYNKELDGNDVELNYTDFISQIKPVNSNYKWAHVFISR